MWSGLHREGDLSWNRRLKDEIRRVEHEQLLKRYTKRALLIAELEKRCLNLARLWNTPSLKTVLDAPGDSWEVRCLTCTLNVRSHIDELKAKTEATMVKPWLFVGTCN